MRLRWIWLTLIGVGCAYILACAGPPSPETAAVDTSGVELAPAEMPVAQPGGAAGMVATVHAVAQAVVAGLKQSISRRNAATKPRLGLRAEPQYCMELIGAAADCCSCCCDTDPCDPCCCACGCWGISCGCSANYSCVTDGTIVQPTQLCGGADQYPLVAMEYGTPYSMNETVYESTSCTPNSDDGQGGGNACSVYYTGGTPPTDGGTCVSGQVVLHPPAPVLQGADAGGYLSWSTSPNILYMGNLSVACANLCYVEQFSISTSLLTGLGPVPTCK